MIIELKVSPGAKKNCFVEEAGRTKVYLTAPPLDGRANEALVQFLGDHYGVRVSAIQIIKGLKSRNKVIKIDTI
jgi:hypothetical protein